MYCLFLQLLHFNSKKCECELKYYKKYTVPNTNIIILNDILSTLGKYVIEKEQR